MLFKFQNWIKNVVFKVYDTNIKYYWLHSIKNNTFESGIHFYGFIYID